MDAHMPAVAKMLKASEAAVVSRVSLRDVNRIIDEHILPEAFVYDVATSVAAGHSTGRILETWPSLDAEKQASLNLC
ncbi:hypothetical protein ILFOPFJJ_06467 [Ensifer psoraleae]|nr:hypothetical protein [Sinorhizobium psoraleae]